MPYCVRLISLRLSRNSLEGSGILGLEIFQKQRLLMQITARVQQIVPNIHDSEWLAYKGQKHRPGLGVSL